MIEGESHGFDLRRVRPDSMTKNIVCRQADDQQVGRRSLAQFFVGYQGAGEVELIIVGERRAADGAIKISLTCGLIGVTQKLARAALPLAVPVFVRCSGGVNCLTQSGRAFM